MTVTVLARFLITFLGTSAAGATHTTVAYLGIQDVINHILGIDEQAFAFFQQITHSSIQVS